MEMEAEAASHLQPNNNSLNHRSWIQDTDPFTIILIKASNNNTQLLQKKKLKKILTLIFKTHKMQLAFITIIIKVLELVLIHRLALVNTCLLFPSHKTNSVHLKQLSVTTLSVLNLTIHGNNSKDK